VVKRKDEKGAGEKSDTLRHLRRISPSQGIDNVEWLRKMSNSNLVGEIRRAMRTKGEKNHLCYALGVILLISMDALSRGAESDRHQGLGGRREKVRRN
jgi:hypothetical protein